MTQLVREPDSLDADEVAAGEAITQRRLVLFLMGLGTLMLVPTLFYAFSLPLTPVRLDRASAGLIEVSEVWSRLADLPWPSPDGAALTASLLVIGALTIAVYVAAVVLCWRRPATRATLAAVLVPAGILLTISAFALPTQSSDIIDYVLSGRVAAVHGESPYEVAPDAFPDDPLLQYSGSNYSSDPEQKPPVWIASAIGAAALTQDATPAVSILITRLLFLALTFANIGLVAAVLKRWRPQHLLAGLVVFAWNPIVLVHGHSRFDTLMATFALLAALLLVLGRRQAATAALTLSILVKLLTLPLLAVSALGELGERRTRQVVRTAAIVIGITVLAYLPFAGGPLRVIEHLGLGDRAGSSLPTLIGIPLVAAAAAVVVWIGLRAGTDIERTLQAWAIASLALIPIIPIGWGWYLLAPIAVISLSGERWLTSALLGLSSVAFLADTWIRSDSPRHPLPTPFGLSRQSAMLLGFLVVGAALAIAVRRQRRLAAPDRA